MSRGQSPRCAFAHKAEMLPDEVADRLDRRGQPRRTEMIVEKVEAASDLADYLVRCMSLARSGGSLRRSDRAGVG